MDGKLSVVGIIALFIILIIFIGLMGFLHYRKSIKNNNASRTRSKNRRKSIGSKSNGSHSSSSSSRRKLMSRSRSKSGSSRSKSSSSKKRHSSSRSRSSRSRNGKSSSSSRKDRHNPRSKSSRSKKSQSFNKRGYPGEIRVELPLEKDTKLKGTGSNILINSSRSDKNLKSVSSNTSIKSSTSRVSKISDKSKVEPIKKMPQANVVVPEKLPKISKVISDTKIAFEGCSLENQISNDLLKYKTNTHYIPSTVVSVQKEVPKSDVVNSVTSVVKEKSKPAQVNSDQDKVSIGSLLTSNNITYNNVHVLVNNSQDSDIKEVVETTINAIPEPNLKLSDLPGLPMSTSKGNDETDDDWEKM